jgi:HNH endonuclease
VARSEARIFTSVWRDQDFIALPPNAKLLYLMLLTLPELSGAGTLPFLVNRWSHFSGLPVPAVERAADELGEDGWLIFDEQEQEAFVSGYFASEKIARQPRRVITANEAIRTLDSERVAAFASAELADLIDEAIPPVPRGVRAVVLKRDGNQCQSCGWKPGDPVPANADGRELYRALEIDHIHPKSKGGPDEEANYQVLCTTCNTKKGNRT